MTPDEMRSLIDRYIAAYNAFDIEGMLEVVHDDVEFRNIAAGETTASTSGKPALRQLAEQSKGLFSERRQEITSFDVEGDCASAGISYEGVLAVDLPNGLTAGDTLRLTGRSEFGFRDGAIDRITDHS